MAKKTDPTSAGVRGRLLGVFGQTPAGEVDYTTASRELGVTPRTVRGWVRGDHEPSRRSAEALSTVERRESHRPKWISVTDEGGLSKGLLRGSKLPPVQDVRGQLMSAYGRVDGTLDTGRAAREVGVSDSTIRSWFNGKSRPKVENQDKLRRNVRTAATESKRGSRLRNMGSAFTLTAVIKVSNDVRERSISPHGELRMTGEQLDRVLAAYAEGGDKAGERALEAVLNEGYARDFGLTLSSVKDFNLPKR